MKLNLTKEQVERENAADMGVSPHLYGYINDWLAMHAELGVRAKLIDRLDDALHNLIPTTSALEVLEEWRKNERLEIKLVTL